VAISYTAALNDQNSNRKIYFDIKSYEAGSARERFSTPLSMKFFELEEHASPYSTEQSERVNLTTAAFWYGTWENETTNYL
jgi:hypothetical protein